MRSPCGEADVFPGQEITPNCRADKRGTQRAEYIGRGSTQSRPRRTACYLWQLEGKGGGRVTAKAILELGFPLLSGVFSTCFCSSKAFFASHTRERGSTHGLCTAVARALSCLPPATARPLPDSPSSLLQTPLPTPQQQWMWRARFKS